VQAYLFQLKVDVPGHGHSDLTLAPFDNFAAWLLAERAHSSQVLSSLGINLGEGVTKAIWVAADVLLCNLAEWDGGTHEQSVKLKPCKTFGSGRCRKYICSRLQSALQLQACQDWHPKW